MQPMPIPKPPAPLGAPKQVRSVLVVDDSVAHARSLAMMLRRWGFDVTEAHSGEDGLAACDRHMPDLIISDWMMPGMSGLDFCRTFRARAGNDFAYFILLTAKSAKDELAAGLDAGADDFTTKPVNFAELRARLNAGARIVHMQRELRQKNAEVSAMLHELQQVHDRIDKDLQQARTIQQSLMPQRFHNFGGASVSLLLEPCGHVGGDLAGMFSPGPDRIGFFNIDVSGHGITSAMMTARVAGYFSADYPDQNMALDRRCEGFYALRSPAQVASLLNQRLVRDVGVAEYLTLNYGALDVTTGRVRLVQAGHPPPVHIRADGTPRFVGQGSMPVGLLEDAVFDQFELVLRPGDKLLFYSDGFTESPVPGGGLLGEDGLLDLIGTLPLSAQGTELLDDLHWLLVQRRGPDRPAEDDVSALLLEYHPQAGR